MKSHIAKQGEKKSSNTQERVLPDVRKKDQKISTMVVIKATTIYIMRVFRTNWKAIQATMSGYDNKCNTTANDDVTHGDRYTWTVQDSCAHSMTVPEVAGLWESGNRANERVKASEQHDSHKQKLKEAIKKCPAISKYRKKTPPFSYFVKKCEGTMMSNPGMNEIDG